MVEVAAVAVVVVVTVIVATRYRRCGGAGIGDGTNTGSLGATLSRSSAANIIEIGLLLPLPFGNNNVVIVVALIVVAASAVGESRGEFLLKRISGGAAGKIFATRRRRCIYTAHCYTCIRTFVYINAHVPRLCVRTSPSVCRVARLRHRVALDTRRPRKVKAGCRACADRFVSCSPRSSTLRSPPCLLLVALPLLSHSTLCLPSTCVTDKKCTAIYPVAVYDVCR